MKWSEDEIRTLTPVLERIGRDAGPLDGTNVLVLCSAAGDVALWLAKRTKTGNITGLELDDELLSQARQTARRQRLEGFVRFEKADKKNIRYPDESFDVVVSEFILFPTTNPTEIGQPELARVLRHGGRLVLTDVIATKTIPTILRQDLGVLGLDYLCDATQDSFRNWMTEAGLVDVDVSDLTSTVRQVWERRWRKSRDDRSRKGFRVLLEDPEFSLGEAIHYIYARGRKP